jgi:hypothetical protein
MVPKENDSCSHFSTLGTGSMFSKTFKKRKKKPDRVDSAYSQFAEPSLRVLIVNISYSSFVSRKQDHSILNQAIV